MLQKLDDDDDDDKAIEDATRIIQMESKLSAFDAKLDAMMEFFKQGRSTARNSFWLFCRIEFICYMLLTL